MDPATVALLVVAFSCCAASTTAGRGPFRYPDDDHVIITQYGPMRYRPVTADEMNRPYDDDGPGTPAASARGYYRAEVIPLDTKTWKPLRQQSAADGGGVWAGGGGGGGSAGTRFDVPLRAGYSVRPAVRRRRRRDRFFLLQSYPPPPYPGARSPPAGTRRLG